MNIERENFEKRFDATEKEVLVLTEGGTSASRGGKNKLWRAGVTALAVVDVSTGEVKKKKCYLEWQMTEKEYEKNMIFDIQKETIYRLRVQESLPFVGPLGTNEIEGGKYLWVKEVLETNCREKQLDKLLEEFQKPVILYLEAGEELLLDKSFGTFSGKGNWNGESCLIHLDVDEQDGVTADEAKETFYKLMENSREWDDKARNYAAEELTETANDWLEDDEEIITEEDFAKRLSISEVCALPDGDFEIFYKDGGMFGGHVIIVSGNIGNGIEDVCMAG